MFWPKGQKDGPRRARVTKRSLKQRLVTGSTVHLSPSASCVALLTVIRRRASRLGPCDPPLSASSRSVYIYKAGACALIRAIGRERSMDRVR